MYGNTDLVDDKTSISGVVKIETSKYYDDKVKKSYDDKTDVKNKAYNFVDNNCATFCSRALTNKNIGREGVV